MNGKDDKDFEKMLQRVEDRIGDIEGFKDKELEFIAGRFKNQLGTAEGPVLPPRQKGSVRIPLVRGLKLARTQSFFGSTLFTLVWDNPTATDSRFINHYIVYAQGLLGSSRVPLGTYVIKESPANVLVQADKATNINLVVQTVHNNGMTSELDKSPSVGATTIAPKAVVSDLGPGTAGQLITWDAVGAPTTIGPGSIDFILVGSGPGAVPQFKSRATLDLVEGRSTVTALGQIVVGSAASGVVKTLAAGAADSILVGSGAGVDAQFKTRTQLDLVEGRANLTTGNKIVKVNTAGVVTQTSFADTDVVTGAANLTDVGAVPFTLSSGVLTDNPANLFWNDTNKTLIVGSASAWSNAKYAAHGLTDENWAVSSISFTHPLLTGMTFHSFNDAVTTNKAFEFRGTPLIFFPAGVASGVIITTQSNPTPQAFLHVQQSTLGNAVLRLDSIATNDDPGWTVYQNRVVTTNATVTTLHTVAIPASTTVALRAIIIARRTGGTAGTAEDGARYELKAVYKNVAGTATLIGAVTKIADEDQVAWDANFTPSAGNVLVEVTGAVNNNITWHLSELDYYPVGS